MSTRLTGDPAPRSEVLTVSALARSVRDLLEHRIPPVWVAGEISNLVLARSGHAYFILKDETAQMRCVMFRHRSQLLDWTPRDGMQVEARALVTLYEPRGDFQLNIETMRRAGTGALYEAFLRLRDKLEREGLFAAEAKRALPEYPRRIGVVTSLAAAALRDVLTTLARRNPSIEVIVYPTLVQGAAAAEEIIAAIGRAGRRREVDVLILARGGGSIEDLWCFNDEALARAIRASPIPIVSGIGHETDFTIADFAADVRAATPTAAAELASPLREEILDLIEALIISIGAYLQRRIEAQMQKIDYLQRRLVHPARRIELQRERLAGLELRLARAGRAAFDDVNRRVNDAIARLARSLPPIAMLAARVDTLGARASESARNSRARAQARVDALERALVHLDPRQVLARGYSIVATAEGKVVTDARAIAPGTLLDIALAHGALDARVERSHTAASHHDPAQRLVLDSAPDRDARHEGVGDTGSRDANND